MLLRRLDELHAFILKQPVKSADILQAQERKIAKSLFYISKGLGFFVHQCATDLPTPC